MAELNGTTEALGWPEEIHAYIAQNNARAAARVIDGILKTAERLGDFPDLGHRWRSVPEGDVRMILYGHYRIAYLRRGDADRIDILEVFHGALDLDRYFP